jgi:hypothetical protein
MLVLAFALPFSIAIQGTNGNGGRERLLEGHTSDVSASGLGLIVHTVRIDGYCIVVDGRPRKLVLRLPNGPVTMSVLPVRSERLGDSGAGYIIGAQITAIDREDRERYSDYLLSGLKPGRKSFLT